MYITKDEKRYWELFIGWKLGYQEIRDELDFASSIRKGRVGN